MNDIKRDDYYDYEKYEMGTPEAAFGTKTLARTRLLRFLEGISKVRKGKVLEVGCGSGGFIQAVKSARGELDCYGCDLSNLYIANAEKKSGGKVEYKVSAAEKLPYDNDSFDIVVVIDVLEHVNDVLVVLNEIFRVLKPGGTFHAYVPCEGNWYTPFFWVGANRLTRKHVGHIQKLSSKELFNLLEKAGFKINRKRYSKHAFGQVLTYFSLYVVKDFILFFFGKETMDSCRDRQTSIKNNSQPKIIRLFLGGLKDCWVAINKPLATIAFYESEIFKNSPLAVGVNVTCLKKIC